MRFADKREFHHPRDYFYGVRVSLFPESATALNFLRSNCEARELFAGQRDSAHSSAALVRRALDINRAARPLSGGRRRATRLE